MSEILLFENHKSLNKNYNSLNTYMCQCILHDLINSKFIKKNKNGYFNILSPTEGTIPSVIGKAFESRILELIKNNNRVKKALFLKLSNRNHINQKHLDKFIPIGTGLLWTKNNYPQHYSPNSPKDLIFLKYGKKSKNFTVNSLIEDTELSPLQIKAAYCNNYLIKSVYNMMSGKYNGYVLTLYRLPNGIHSKDFIISTIKSYKENRKITIDGKKYSLNKTLRNKIIDKIISPEDISISQSEIDEYYKYIYYFLSNNESLQNDPLFIYINFTCFVLLDVYNKSYPLDFESIDSSFQELIKKVKELY